MSLTGAGGSVWPSLAAFTKKLRCAPTRASPVSGSIGRKIPIHAAQCVGVHALKTGNLGCFLPGTPFCNFAGRAFKATYNEDLRSWELKFRSQEPRIRTVFHTPSSKANAVEFK
jgi:hypothetical protein